MKADTRDESRREAVDFLQKLRPGGPWVLTAILPDGPTVTITARDADAVRKFIRANDGKKNLYFSVNPTRKVMTSKAAKTDIAAIEYLLADLDPKDNESPEAAKARYLEGLELHKPPVTVIIDSGNGIQGLWKLAERIELAEPVMFTNAKGKTEKAFPSDIATIISDAEARTAALMERLGSVAGTQNIDRILRLPGTTNLPNKKKTKAGRVACPTRLIRFNDATCSLHEFPAPEPNHEQRNTGTGTADGSPTGRSVTELFATLSAALQKLIASPALPNEDRSRIAALVIGSLIQLGCSDAEITALFEVYPNGIGKRYAEGKDLAAELRRMRKKWGDRNKPRDSTLPVVQITAGALSKLATRAEQILQEAGLPIYQRSGALVRPIIEEVDAAHGCRTKVAQLKAIDPVYVRDLLDRVANWVRFNLRAGRWLPADPPPAIGATILARVGEWKFPVIAGVVSTQTMRPDGSLLTEPGYDPATRLLLVEPPPMMAIPDAPTRDDALAALALLEDLLTEFPLVDETAKAVALSAIITPVVRGAFSVTPMHAARAPVAGSGKSFLFDTVAAIAIGQRMPVMAAGRNQEETEKRLGASLLAGQPLISVDNVNGELAGDALCQIIERPIVDIRILGKSERVRIETRGTTMFCTGNNIVLVGDLCRRAITITLDPKLERPELRQFKGSPVEKVLANRGAYIAACLTICRAYIVAGQPNKAPKLASFEGWSDTVRSALIWLGKADPVASMELSRAEDPELGALREFHSAWAEAIGIGYKYHCTLADVIALSVKQDNGQLLWPRLNAAVQAVDGKYGPVDAQKLGTWARGKKDRVVGDLRLANKPNAKGAAEWWVEHSDGKLEQAPSSVEESSSADGNASSEKPSSQSAPGWSARL